MAASGSKNLPTFEEIVKRGSISEPRNIRPVPKIRNVNQTAELSLNAAVDAANKSRDKKKNIQGKSKSERKSHDSKNTHSHEAPSSDGSPKECRRRTPMTMPRTKVTSATPLEQRIALNKLKQKLNFDNAPKNNDGKKDKPSPRTTMVNMSQQMNAPADVISVSSTAASEAPASEMSDLNISKLTDRLNQVREYLKQATSMYVSLSIAGSDEPTRAEQMSKLARLIQQLRIQEQGYLDLFKKTANLDDQTSDVISVVSTDQQSIAYESQDLSAPQHELERLREQQGLLKKIVDQQKELQELKDRQASLLQMQQNAENLIKQQHQQNSMPNNKRVTEAQQQNNLSETNATTLNNQQVASQDKQSPQQHNYANKKSVSDTEETVLLHADAAQKRLQLESKLMSLQGKKYQMDQLMTTLKSLKNAQNIEGNMISALNQDDLSEVASELAANSISSYDENNTQSHSSDIHEKIAKLNEARERLHELRGIVGEFEQSSNLKKSPTTTDASRDNRLRAQAIQQKEGNTLTGVGGARLRLENANNQDMLINDLQALQNGIEELMIDNRKRPVPTGRAKKQIDVTRNPPLKSKNTNQEKRIASNVSELEMLFKDLPEEYLEKMKELQLARERLADDQNYVQSDNESTTVRSTTTQTERDSESAKDSEFESDCSSALQWQDDPEFQLKVKKLEMAKEKLRHLQELVKVVQQGGGPHLPLGDLENLTLTLSDDQRDSSEYGSESEEEADDDNAENSDDDDEDEEEEEEDDDDNDEDEDEDADGEQTEEDVKSEVSKSTDMNYNFQEVGLSDNERRYQGLLRKQRLELNNLLKERERLLEAQHKLSNLAAQPVAVSAQTQTSVTSPQSINSHKHISTLTRKELTRQEKYKQKPKKSLLSKFTDASVQQHYGSEHDYFPPDVIDNSDDKELMTVPLSNPMAVSEIRRQRDLFEQRKKQKFVEKQRRKKKNHVEENQSDDRATYSVHSDIDEGVGVSMYSADVTTAGTWGGSTEQSSSEEDSAVGDDYPAAHQDLEEGEDDVYGSHFDQAEEEEEVGGISDVPPIFKVKKFEDRARRGISWDQNDITRGKKRKLSDKKTEGGSVSWSLDVSPPRSRLKPRQGNLTPAHKLIQDRERKRQHIEQQKEGEATIHQPSEQLHTQLASMCTSLLRNEQTLLSMLQSQTAKQKEDVIHTRHEVGNCDALKSIQEFYETSNYHDNFQEALSSLRSCYDRVQQHQLDMEFLHQQFSLLNSSVPTSSVAEYRSPWPNPPSLHLSSFGNVENSTKKRTTGNSKTFSSTIPSCLKPTSSYPKHTQTDTSLFEDPFKTSIQTYTLFGENSLEGGISPRITNKTDEEFNFEPVLDPTSPGAIGERSFAQHYEEQNEEDADFPYRLSMSEYNPLSYQGNFADTCTGNVVTMSRMSMTKDRADTNVSMTKDRSGGDEHTKIIWPSFFKLADGDNASEKSSKYTSSLAGNSASNDVVPKNAEINKKIENELPRESSAGSNFSLFEALRDTIYSEVATLIAMNESRPHYLIELFRELQLLNSDYLRQRALYSLQELVTRYLTDEEQATTSPSKAAFMQETIPSTTAHAPYEQWIASASEQTPSESVMTTDDESESQALQSLAKQIQNNDIYDYAELADTQSEGNLSTPGSQSDAPFAAEDLGNTVINLDEALQKMKMYEQNMAEAKKAFERISHDVRESTPASAAKAAQDRQNAAYEAIKRRISNLDTVSNSSAGDVTSETSSDMPQPSIDTQKLDRQIKAVMMDLIPFLNENIENTCTEGFLDNIRNLIVQFAKQKESESEKEQFGRFFHMQLDSILRDSLMKFSSRKLKECGEDILIDVSEILFNELAFFRLMQDLDRPLYAGASADTTGTADTTNHSIEHPAQAQHSKMPFFNHVGENESSAAESVDTEENLAKATSSTSSSNAYVVIDPMNEISDEETESSKQFVKVELSVSETRPIRSSGSGEDDTEEEPSLFSKVSAPSSSIHLYSNIVNGQEAGMSSSQSLHQVLVQPAVQEPELLGEVEDDRDEGDQAVIQEDECSEHEREVAVDDRGEDERTADEEESAEDERGIGAAVEVEGAVVENSVEQDDPQQNETEEATEDDLPEADMLSDENTLAAQVVLAHLEGEQELVGSNDAPLFPGNAN